MKTIIAVLLCAVCLSACGKRGKLEFPPGTTYPRQYPVSQLPEQKQKKDVTIKQEDNQPQSILELNQSLEAGN